MCPGVIVHTVVENHERPGVYAALYVRRLVFLDLRHNHFLALHEIFENVGLEFTVDEKRRNHFSVEGVRFFRAADDGAEGHILVVEEEIADERGFAGAAATDENDYGVLGDTFHVEALDVEVYVAAGGHLGLHTGKYFFCVFKHGQGS